MKVAATELRKSRDIDFAPFPPAQVPEATVCLQQVEAVDVAPKAEKQAVHVDYDLRQHTLQELEDKLCDEGFHLDNALLCKLKRALVHYAEETQLRNLDAPERLVKKPHEAYARVWDKHLHGDHDDTPAEWREYK